jgi:hypothetical protein
MAITVQSTYSSHHRGRLCRHGRKRREVEPHQPHRRGCCWHGVRRRRLPRLGDHGCTGTPAAANKFMGIVIADAGQVPGVGGTADTLAQYATAPSQRGRDLRQRSVAVPRRPGLRHCGGAITNVSTSNTAIPARFDATTAAAPASCRCASLARKGTEDAVRRTLSRTRSRLRLPCSRSSTAPRRGPADQVPVVRLRGARSGQHRRRYVGHRHARLFGRHRRRCCLRRRQGLRHPERGVNFTLGRASSTWRVRATSSRCRK